MLGCGDDDGDASNLLDLWNGVHFFEEPQTGVCSKIPRSDLELPEVSEFGESRDISPPMKFGTGH